MKGGVIGGYTDASEEMRALLRLQVFKMQACHRPGHCEVLSHQSAKYHMIQLHFAVSP